jgi:hypothetical protein
LKRSDIFIKEVLEFFVGQHFIDEFKDGLFVLIPTLAPGYTRCSLMSENKPYTDKPRSCNEFTINKNEIPRQARNFIVQFILRNGFKFQLQR